MTTKPSIDITLLTSGERRLIAGLIGYSVGISLCALYFLAMIAINIRDAAGDYRATLMECPTLEPPAAEEPPTPAPGPESDLTVPAP